MKTRPAPKRSATSEWPAVHVSRASTSTAPHPLDRARRADRLAHHPGGRLVAHALFVLVRLQLRMEGEFLPAVDRRHEAAALAVEIHVHPGRRMRNVPVESGDAAIDSVHA